MKEYLDPSANVPETRQKAWRRLHNKKKPPQSTSPEDFENRLDSILERFTTVSTGHVQLLNYENIIKDLGDFYKERKDHVLQIITNSIERRLSQHDVYTKYGESSFVIVFADLGEKEAQLKTQLMAEEISTRLLGNSKKKNIVQVKTAMTKQDGKLLFEKTPSIATLAQTFEKITPTTETNSKDMDHFGENLDILKDVQFIFRPMWFVKNRVVSTFFCIPMLCTAENSYMSGYSLLTKDTDTKNIFELDIISLDKVGKELKSMSDENKMALIAVPVHFETLANRNRRSKYVNQCRKVLSEYTSKVLFEIIGLPEGVPDSRLSEFFTALQPFSRSVLARFSLDHTNFDGFRAAGVHSVGMDLFDSQLSEKEIIERLDRFVEAANKASLKTYVHGVKTISLSTAAITMGFDYLDGYAVTSVAESVDGAYILEMGDIYTSA